MIKKVCLIVILLLSFIGLTSYWGAGFGPHESGAVRLAG
jgi:hypothetical protein